MRARMQRSDGELGFSLIELLVATVIITLVMAGGYSLVSQSLVMQRLARDHYVAVSLGMNRLERARNFNYDQLWMLEESAVLVDEVGNPAANGDFRRTTNVDTNYTVNSTEVEVVVELRSPYTFVFDGRSESVSTVFTEYLEFD